MGVDSSKMDAGLKDFIKADDFRDAKAISSTFLETFNLDPNNHKQAVKKIKQIFSGKKKTAWAYLEKKAAQPIYQKGEVCKDAKVLVIGCGPCGLRLAIEAALLGAKVRMVEAKDTFDRHNVVHLWPFVIQDLKKLGARFFYPDFCTNGRSHISIRRLQLILLKVALLLGVEISAPVTFEKLVQPGDENRWRAQLSPSDHVWNEWEFDVIVGAAGKGNVLTDFKCKSKMRKKQTIMITANFRNNHSQEEDALEDSSSRFSVYNQEFFEDLRRKTGMELESFVYCKDETHSFVMTVKRDNLIRNKILKEKTAPREILNPNNICREKLASCVKKVVKHVMGEGIPFLNFTLNKAREDVYMFDCTASFYTDNACMVTERLGCRLLQMVVGDRLMEPFWPTGAGCGRGFLSVLDAAWLISRWFQGNASPLELIAERESIYQLLPQTAPENLKTDITHYTIDPKSRYGVWIQGLTLHSRDVRHLYDTDHQLMLEKMTEHEQAPKDSSKPATQSKDFGSDAKDLLSWYQKQLKPYKKVKVTNLTTSWSSGVAFCCALHSVDADIVDVQKLSPEEAVENVAKAFTIIEAEFNFRPFMTPEEVASGKNLDKVEMFAFLGRLRQALISYNQGTAEQMDICGYGKRGHHLYDSLSTMLTSIGFLPPKKSLTPKSSMESPHVDVADVGASRDILAARSPPAPIDRTLPPPPKPPRVHFESEGTRGILTEPKSRPPKPDLKPKPRHKSAPASRPQDDKEEEEEMYMTAVMEIKAADPHPSLAALSGNEVVKKRLKELRFQDEATKSPDARPKLQAKSRSADVSTFEPVFDVDLRPDRMLEKCCLCEKKMATEERRQLLEDSGTGRAFSFHRDCFRCCKCDCTLRYGNVLPHKDQSGKISFYCFMHAPQKSNQLKHYKSSSQQGGVQKGSTASSQDLGFGPKSLAKFLGDNVELGTNPDEAAAAGQVEEGKEAEEEEEEYYDLDVSVMGNQSYKSLMSTHMLMAHELQLEVDQLEEMEEEGADQPHDNPRAVLCKKLDDLEERISKVRQKIDSTSLEELQDVVQEIERQTKMYEDSLGISS